MSKTQRLDLCLSVSVTSATKYVDRYLAKCVCVESAER